MPTNGEPGRDSPLVGTLDAMSVRVRFAPSPTGNLHVGALRDALFKYLFARHEGGVNIFRIEDTDRARYSAESEQEFVDSLGWVGITFQEGPHLGGPNGPYRQSERKEAGIYAEWIERLLAEGKAYKAFDTPEELEEMREFQQINKQPVGYFGGAWRDAKPEEVAKAEGDGRPHVIRQRIPRGQTIVIEDLIRGRIEWDSDTIDDPVLIKGDGMPTYHFAAMVDDHLMGITHIIRGEEWISSAPKHACLFDAFGWERPIFVHCPVIKGKDGKKLSKRHGATRVLDYRAEGFLPEALLNFVALIGWSPGGDRELMSLDELAEAFTLGGIQPSPGVFDIEKLRWMNGHYIRSMETNQLFEKVVAYAQDPLVDTYWQEFVPEGDQKVDAQAIRKALHTLRGAAAENYEYALEAVRLEQERVVTLADFGPATEFFFLDEPAMDEKAVEKWLRGDHVRELLTTLHASLDGSSSVSAEDCEQTLRWYAENKGFEKLGPVVHPTRVALTGKTFGPGLFELMALLGPERMKGRLQRALALL